MKTTMRSFSARTIAILAVASSVIALSPGVAKAHDSAGIPGHTFPQMGAYGQDAFGRCYVAFYNPVVLGLTYQYVYWRPIALVRPPLSNMFQPAVGEWRRAWTSPSAMIYGWESVQWPDYAWKFSNGMSYTPFFQKGSTIALGAEYRYGSLSGTQHIQFINGTYTC